MKIFKVKVRDRIFAVRAASKEQAIFKLADSVLSDDRLSPTTYRKLKEFGYSSKDWEGWSQEQANAVVRKHMQEASANTSEMKSKEKREASFVKDYFKDKPFSFSSVYGCCDALHHKDGFHKVKQEIIDDGRGLSARLNKPEEKLTEEQQEFIKEFSNCLIGSPENVTLYRKDDTDWLGELKPGDDVDLRILCCTSTDREVIPEEIRGRVKQQIIFEVEAGCLMMGTNNYEEKEIVLGGTSEELPRRNKARLITQKGVDEQLGCPVYVVKIFRENQEE